MGLIILPIIIFAILFTLNVRSSSTKYPESLAYTSFRLLGLISFWASYLFWGITNVPDGIIGFGIILPFGIPILILTILGPALSLFLWRCRNLMILTSLSVLLVILMSVLSYATWSAILIIYGATCIIISSKRFIKHSK